MMQGRHGEPTDGSKCCWSVGLSICLCIYTLICSLSVHQVFFLSHHLSLLSSIYVYASACLPFCLSIFLSIYFSICPSVFLSTYVCISVSIFLFSTSLFVHLPSACLSVYLFTYECINLFIFSVNLSSFSSVSDLSSWLFLVSVRLYTVFP